MIDHISVCICTYHRNPTLERLLVNLAAQTTGGEFEFSVVVVDNDAKGPARELVGRLERTLHLRISYGIEPVQTIPAARNRAVRMAAGNYVAIIDDDEFPPPDWLSKLHRTIRMFEVDGILGPVIPFFERHPPAWLIKGRFCERPIYRTGTLLQWNQTRTGNVLLKKDIFTVHELFFDLKWQTSGSDRDFFKRAMRKGLRFAAVEDAPVFEIVPPERWKKSYYWRRAVVQGFNSFRHAKESRSGFFTAKSAMKSAGAIFACAAAMPFCALLGSHWLVRCIEREAYFLSFFVAMFGIELIKRRDF